MKFAKNVFSAFGVLFIITAIIIPIQNLIVWGPDFASDFYNSQEITAEKLSIGVIAFGVFMIFLAHKKADYIQKL